MSGLVHWFAKFLQVSGLVTTLYALPFGFLAEESKRMTYELGLLAVGAAVFALGRLIDSRSRG